MKIDFAKNNGLVPVIIQDHTTDKVLMLGYMNQEAYHKTLEEKLPFIAGAVRNYGPRARHQGMSCWSEKYCWIVIKILF